MEKAANIKIQAQKNLAWIAERAGNADVNARVYEDGRLYVEGVTQDALEAAAAEYDEETNGHKDYVFKRRAAYPPDGDQLDAAFKHRQKMKMLAGQAKAALAEGSVEKALGLLLEAIEPPADADAVDSKILQVKRQFPK